MAGALRGERALADATSRKIRYDFAMDAEDHSRLFCAEVASAGLQRGRHRAMARSFAHLVAGPGELARGVRRAPFRHAGAHRPGVRLQLRVVAEWRDTEALFADHVDNAVTDALIETAEAVRRLLSPGIRRRLLDSSSCTAPRCCSLTARVRSRRA